MCLLNRHNLSVARFASKEESRYTLSMIQVTSKETIATDGRLLVRVSRPSKPTVKDFPQREGFQAEEITRPVLIPAGTALIAMRALSKENTIPVLDFAALSSPDGDGERRLAVTNLEMWQDFRVSAPAKNVCFPKIGGMWKRADDAKFSLSLNAKSLRNLLDAVVKFRGNNQESAPEVCISFYAANEALRLDAYNAETDQLWTALLMPCLPSDPRPREPDLESCDSTSQTKG